MTPTQPRRRPGRPRGPRRIQSKIRLTPEIHAAVTRRAATERRSLTAVIELAVLHWLDTTEVAR